MNRKNLKNNIYCTTIKNINNLKIFYEEIINCYWFTYHPF